MLILHNANIYTHNNTPAEAVAILDGRIQAVGNNADVLNLSRPGDIIQDMEGSTVWPGLTDSHIHLQHYALGLDWIDCETNTREECINRVREAVLKAKPGTWIRGHGWNQNVWPEGFGTAALLDAIAPNNPVYLTAKSLHASWANSAALRQAGIHASTPDPEGGRILRDERGQPNGILFESAMGLVEQVIPAASVGEIREAIRAAQNHLWQMGLTGVHDFDRRECFMALQQLELAGDLKLRVLKSIPLEELSFAAALGLHTGFGSNRLRIGSVKLFADGALGPQTAAMLQPYENSTDTGLAFLDSEQIFEFGQKASETGLSLAIHAIGDRANHEVLKAYTQLRELEKTHRRPQLRHRIEHVQVLHPDHLKRLAQLDVVASMQPIHATSDMDIADRYWGGRAKYAYAFNTLLSNGTRLAFGSDAPVESPNPFWGLHAAVTRQRHTGYPTEEGWNSQERLTLKQALDAYTIHPAYTAGWENHIGQLAVGFAADCIVLDEDPFNTSPQALYQLHPTSVMVGGEWVWQA